MPRTPIVSSSLPYLYPAEAPLATNSAVRRALRRIPRLRSISGQELYRIQERLIRRSYRPGDVLWRTRRNGGFMGFIQSGEIELEYRINGVLVRSTRLSAGDPVLPHTLPGRSQHTTVLARAVTDVILCMVPKLQVDPLMQSQRIMRMHVDNSGGSVWLKRAWPLLLLLLIVSLARADMVRIASGLLYRAANHEPYYPLEDPRPMELLKYAEQVDSGAAFAYNEEGYWWFQQERLPDAQTAFVQAVDRDPVNAPALNNMAITYFTLGDLPQSARFLQQAAEQDPDNALVRYNLGIILMHQNEPVNAIHEFRQAGFIDPTAAAPHLQQAVLYIQLGDYMSAEQRARTTIQLDPSQPSAHLLLAIALYNQGRDTEALTSIADSLWLEPGNRVASFYQALLLGRIGQFDAALPILESLLATSTDSQEAARISVEIEAVHRSLSELEVVAH